MPSCFGKTLPAEIIFKIVEHMVVSYTRCTQYHQAIHISFNAKEATSLRLASSVFDGDLVRLLTLYHKNEGQEDDKCVKEYLDEDREEILCDCDAGYDPGFDSAWLERLRMLLLHQDAMRAEGIDVQKVSKLHACVVAACRNPSIWDRVSKKSVRMSYNMENIKAAMRTKKAAKAAAAAVDKEEVVNHQEATKSEEGVKDADFDKEEEATQETKLSKKRKECS